MTALKNHGAQAMTKKAIDKSARSERTTVLRRAAGNNAKSTRDHVSNTIKDHKREALVPGRVTKHGALLQLLNRPEGASIDDMMQATEWQQHSVRGFLAGTVKKKMGLALTSTKAEGEFRRYRIATSRRGR